MPNFLKAAGFEECFLQSWAYGASVVNLCRSQCKPDSRSLQAPCKCAVTWKRSLSELRGSPNLLWLLRVFWFPESVKKSTVTNSKFWINELLLDLDESLYVDFLFSTEAQSVITSLAIHSFSQYLLSPYYELGSNIKVKIEKWKDC